ncbi:MAG: hypothetical protein ACRDL8_19340, partial [Solirubrobacteraceae bacterium]
MDRRAFLRTAVVVGSGAIAGVTAAGCSGAPGRPRESHGSAPPHSAATGSVGGPPDWPSLARSLSGTLLRPGDAGYQGAGHLY